MIVLGNNEILSGYELRVEMFLLGNKEVKYVKIFES